MNKHNLLAGRKLMPKDIFHCMMMQLIEFLILKSVAAYFLISTVKNIIT